MMRLKLIVTAALTLTLLDPGFAGFCRAEADEPAQLASYARAAKNQALSIPDGEKTMMPWADEVMLFDFNSNDAVALWRAVNDTVMGGISTGRIEQSADGKAVFTGEVSLENNGGFASVQGPEIEPALGGFDGIAIRVRGDGKRYKCGLRTDDQFDGVSHQASFATTAGEWQVVQVPFADFIPTYHGRRLSEDKRLKPEHIRKLGFLISDKQDGIFRLEIDWIKAYR